MKNSIRILYLALLALALPACGGEAGTDTGTSNTTAVSLPEGLFVNKVPDGAISVFNAVTKGKPGQDVVILAKIGGRKSAFVESRSIFVAADAQLLPCPPEEGCPTPWDYCCDTPETLRDNTITVQVSDADGKPFKRSLQGAHGLEPLTDVYVAGKLRAVGDAMILDATKIHVLDD